MLVGASIYVRWMIDRCSLEVRSIFVGVDAQIDIRHMLDRSQIDVKEMPDSFSTGIGPIFERCSIDA